MRRQCRRTLPRFQATFRGRDVFSYRNLPRSQIRYAPIFEWLEAAHWRGYTWESFCALESDEQALVIAHYRTHHQLAAVEAWYNRPKP